VNIPPRRVAIVAALLVSAVILVAFSLPRGSVNPPKPIVYESYETDLLATGRHAVCGNNVSSNCQTIGYDLDVGDLDADGTVEFVAVGESLVGSPGVGQAVTLWHYAEASAEFRLVAEGWNNTAPEGGYSFEAYAVALGDVDGDGALEIVVGGRGTRGGDVAYLSVWRWDGAANLTREAHTTWSFGIETYLKDIAISDFDADGEPEVLAISVVDPFQVGIGEVTLWNYSAGMLRREGRFTIEDTQGPVHLYGVAAVPVAPAPRALVAAGGALLLLNVTGAAMQVVADETSDTNESFTTLSRVAVSGDGFRALAGGTEGDPPLITVREVLLNATDLSLGNRSQLAFASSPGWDRITGVALSGDGQIAAVTGLASNLTVDHTVVLQLMSFGPSGLSPYALNEFVTTLPGSTEVRTLVNGVVFAEVSSARSGPEVLTVGRFWPQLEIRLWSSTR